MHAQKLTGLASLTSPPAQPTVSRRKNAISYQHVGNTRTTTCSAIKTPHFNTKYRRTSACRAGVSRDVYRGIHHVGVLCKDISASMEFYGNILGRLLASHTDPTSPADDLNCCWLLKDLNIGMEVNPERPDDKLPYKGAWLWVGGEMIHLMELPNPDPEEGRPEHGGRDRHVCLSVHSIAPVEKMLKEHNIAYTKSQSGRAALFFRDPDWNVLEMAEQ